MSKRVKNVHFHQLLGMVWVTRGDLAMGSVLLRSLAGTRKKMDFDQACSFLNTFTQPCRVVETAF